MPESVPRKRLLIFVVAYYADAFIQQVIRRIPIGITELYETEILVIDDASKDQTFERAVELQQSNAFPFKINVLVNPVNQGYGGNQKLGFHYAIKFGFDFVALLHGDGQYAPECLPDLISPLADGTADAVLGSRMMTRGGALGGGMPLYKYVGNKILTWCQNKLLYTSFSEFHTGYRIYSINALRKIPFELNANAFHFDTEIILQLLIAGQRIHELPIPTYYGEEISRVNGMRYAFDVMIATLKARVQSWNILYERKYDCATADVSNSHYTLKLGFRSSHSLAIDAVPPGSRVLELGCAGGYLGLELKKKGCIVTGVDYFPLAENVALDDFVLFDLDKGLPPIDMSQFDVVLLLDVIEHLREPETFVAQLRQVVNPQCKIIVSTGNIAFIFTRLSLLLGHFNYGKRGILDLTHTRLFTFTTFQNLFQQANYEIVQVKGTPVPFPLIVRNKSLANVLVSINSIFVGLSRSLFAFQSFLIVQPRPTLQYLLQQAYAEAETRTKVEPGTMV